MTNEERLLDYFDTHAVQYFYDMECGFNLLFARVNQYVIKCGYPSTYAGATCSAHISPTQFMQCIKALRKNKEEQQFIHAKMYLDSLEYVDYQDQIRKFFLSFDEKIEPSH